MCVSIFSVNRVHKTYVIIIIMIMIITMIITMIIIMIMMMVMMMMMMMMMMIIIIIIVYSRPLVVVQLSYRPVHTFNLRRYVVHWFTSSHFEGSITRVILK